MYKCPEWKGFPLQTTRVLTNACILKKLAATYLNLKRKPSQMLYVLTFHFIPGLEMPNFNKPNWQPLIPKLQPSDDKPRLLKCLITIDNMLMRARFGSEFSKNIISFFNFSVAIFRVNVGETTEENSTQRVTEGKYEMRN